MAAQETLKLVELVALALPAYALVLKTMADQPSQYPTRAIKGLAGALGCIGVAGIVIVASLLNDGLPPGVMVGILFVIASLVLMLYGIWHYTSRQEELEGDPQGDEKGQ